VRRKSQSKVAYGLIAEPWEEISCTGPSRSVVVVGQGQDTATGTNSRAAKKEDQKEGEEVERRRLHLQVLCWELKEVVQGSG